MASKLLYSTRQTWTCENREYYVRARVDLWCLQWSKRQRTSTKKNNKWLMWVQAHTLAPLAIPISRLFFHPRASLAWKLIKLCMHRHLCKSLSRHRLHRKLEEMPHCTFSRHSIYAVNNGNSVSLHIVFTRTSKPKNMQVTSTHLSETHLNGVATVRERFSLYVVWWLIIKHKQSDECLTPADSACVKQQSSWWSAM